MASMVQDQLVYDVAPSVPVTPRTQRRRARAKLSRISIPATTTGLCRDEDCDIIGIHAPHIVTSIDDTVYGGGKSSRKPVHGDTLADVIYDNISSRTLKTFAHIFDDVVNDYGEIPWMRTVYRSLANLVEERRVAHVVVPYRNKRGQIMYRYNNGKRDLVMTGGYIRYDSPLIWSADGYSFLVEQIEDTYTSSQP